MSANISISRLLIFIFLIVTSIASVTLMGFTTFVQDKSIRNIAKDDAHQHAELVFESLYAVMKNGWTREEIEEIVERFDAKLPNVHLRLIRSELVADLFGDIEQSRHIRESDPLIRSVFQNKREEIEEIDDKLRFIYPVIATSECLGCHTNAKDGDINGVIEITFPTATIGLPMEYALNLVMAAFGVIFMIILVITIAAIRNLMVKPITDLSQYMFRLQHNKPVDKMRPSRIIEIENLRDSFHNLFAHLKDANKELEDLTVKDPLTGLSNRRHFDEVLSKEIERANRYGHSFSIVMIDLDKFKPINDTYGHDAGDFVLKEISLVLTSILRTSDLLARVGGDEFQVIAPESSKQDALTLGEKLRQAVSTHQMKYNGVTLRLSCSIGVATWGDDGVNLGELQRIADQHMYEDKKSRKMSRS